MLQKSTKKQNNILELKTKDNRADIGSRGAKISIGFIRWSKMNNKKEKLVRKNCRTKQSGGRKEKET